MVKLETNTEYDDTVFYFHNMKDCKEFMRVFANHWCNVPWKKPVEKDNFYGIDESKINAKDKPPKQRAEDDLSWGFSLARFLKCDLTFE